MPLVTSIEDQLPYHQLTACPLSGDDTSPPLSALGNRTTAGAGRDDRLPDSTRAASWLLTDSISCFTVSRCVQPALVRAMSQLNRADDPLEPTTLHDVGERS